MADPWIGNDFGNPENRLAGIRLLVLGESQYSDAHPVGQVHAPMTQDAVEWYLAGHHLRFFSNIAGALSGHPQSKFGRAEHHQLWQCLAFYNYIPVVVANSARKFDERYWALGTEEFEAVLASILPDAVLVCGYRLFPRILRRHTPGFDGDPWAFEGEVVQLGGPSRPVALRMMHPSAAFSAKIWAPKIKKLLQQAAARDLDSVTA